MEPWTQIKEPETIKVGWRTLVRKTFERPDGIPAEYVTKEALGARCGAVIALTPDNMVVVAEQFRPGPEEVFQDLPGGGIDEGEDEVEAIMRELKEETGYVSSEVELLGFVRDAYSNATWYYVLARNCRLSHDQELGDGEFVNVKLISIDQLLENARTGKMGDLGGLFLACDILQKIQSNRA